MSRLANKPLYGGFVLLCLLHSDLCSEHEGVKMYRAKPKITRKADNWWRPPVDLKVHEPMKKEKRTIAIEYLRNKNVHVFDNVSSQRLATLLWESTGNKCRVNFSKREARAYIRKFVRALSPTKQAFTKKKSGWKRSTAHPAAKAAFLESWEWTTLRYKVLQKFGPRCMCCGATRETGAVLHVDHIKPRSKFPELALDINNLQVLCATCNKGKGNWDETDFRDIETTLTPEQEEHMRTILQ